MVIASHIIYRPESWPLGWCLPVRHCRELDCGMWKCGIILDGTRFGVAGWQTTVYLALLGEFKTVRELLTHEKVEYPSVNALLQDWVVD